MRKKRKRKEAFQGIAVGQLVGLATYPTPTEKPLLIIFSFFALFAPFRGYSSSLCAFAALREIFALVFGTRLAPKTLC